MHSATDGVKRAGPGQRVRQDTCLIAHHVRCDAFDGFPCLVNGKADAQIICVDPALRNPNLTLLTNAYVERLETNPSDRTVTKVHVERNGTHEEYGGDIVVVGCGAINSALLLLRSGNDRHPNGLANGSEGAGFGAADNPMKPSSP